MRRTKAFVSLIALVIIATPLAVIVAANDIPVIDEDLWLDFRYLYDRDGDHSVTFDEFAAKRQRNFDDLRLFAALDRNDDRVITLDDFGADGGE